MTGTMFWPSIQQTTTRAWQARQQELCPGHVASKADKKICGRCGIHIDALR